jgi:hypothetical protein
MNMHTYYLGLPFFLIVVGITLWNIIHYHHQLPNKLTGSDGKWCFKDWATPLITITAGLGLILTLTQKNVLITGISLLCGAIILTLPLAYTTLCEPAQRTWTFLIFASLMLWAVGLELVVAAALADDSIVTDVPSAAIHAFRGLMLIAAFIALCYYGKSSRQLLREQTTSPKEHVPDTTAPTSSIIPPETVAGSQGL